MTRREHAASLVAAAGQPEPSGYAAWLRPAARVPLDARVRKIAADVARLTPGQ